MVLVYLFGCSCWVSIETVGRGVSYWVVTRDTEPASVVFLPKSRERREGQGGLGGSGGHGYDELCIWGGWRPGLVDEGGKGEGVWGWYLVWLWVLWRSVCLYITQPWGSI